MLAYRRIAGGVHQINASTRLVNQSTETDTIQRRVMQMNHAQQQQKQTLLVFTNWPAFLETTAGSARAPKDLPKTAASCGRPVQDFTDLVPFLSPNCQCQGTKLFVCLFAWGLTALSAQVGYIVP